MSLSVSKLVEIPTSQANLFEFIFSSPFAPRSRVVAEAPAHLRGHTVPLITRLKPLYIDGATGANISYSKLESDAISVASTLRQSLSPASLAVSDPKVNCGAVISPIVMLHLPNSLQFVTLAFGVLASGLTVTGANPALTAPEIAHILSLSRPSIIVTTISGLSSFQSAFELLSAETRQELGYATQRNVFLVDLATDDYGMLDASLKQKGSWNQDGWIVQDWKILLEPSAVRISPPKYVGNEGSLRAAVIFWSSGTSGKSKGVIISHAASSSAVIGCWYGSGMKANERLVALPPFYHIFGWANCLLPGPAYGATVSIISKFEPQKYLQLVQDTRATFLHIAPPIAVLFAKSPLMEGFDVSSVKTCTSGGAPLGTSVIKAVYERLGFMVKMGYGLSETAGTTGQTCATYEELQKVLGSAGPAFPGVELKIVDLETGKVSKMGEEGEILIRCKFLLTAYLNNPEATAEALTDDGWFKTGDAGKFDAEFNLYIVDRLKDVLKVKGFQVAPSELEDGLCAHPLVQDAGVSSVYHEDHATEYPRAWVVPKDEKVLLGGKHAEEFAHEVRKHMERKLVPYKWLRGGIVIVPTIPKSPAGKILRRMLKDTKGHFIPVYEEKIRAKL